MSVELGLHDISARRLRITGRVQGVGFRHHLRHEARRLQLSGWVRNCHDGSVEACIAGFPDALAALLVWAHRGPKLAKVEQVHVESLNDTERSALQAMPDFEQWPDA